MKRFYSVVILLVVLLLAGTADVVAQTEYVPTPVEISQNKVRIGDKIFYEHLVKERQTLFSICKVYGVSEATIKECNPGKLDNGLKTGSVLLIPVASGVSAERTVAEKASPAVESVEEETSAADTTGTSFISHRVRWYDSLTTISLKYKVSQEEIMKANNLSSRTLNVNQVLRIPVGESSGTIPEDLDDSLVFDVEEPGAEQEAQPDTLISIFGDEPSQTIDEEGEHEEEPEEDLFKPFTGKADIALLLPIAAGSSSPSSNFLDFYAGVMMGLNEIKDEGIDVKLTVVDMADYDDCEAMIEATNLEDCDFVIGNFSPATIGPVADYCDFHHIPLVSPLDQKIEQATYSHPWLVNVPVSSQTQIRNTIQSIDYSSAEDNVLVIYESGTENSAYFTSLCNMLDSLDVPFNKFSYGITGGRDIHASIQNLLDSSKENHIFVASEKEYFASDAIRNIALVGRGGKYSINSYGSHKVRSLDSIDPSFYNDANMHFCLGYYVDYGSDETSLFVRQYRALYNCEPGPFAFQGRDITVYFIHALERYGSRMVQGIENYPKDLIQLKFNFGRRGEHSGMFNEATKNIVYGENLSVESF